MKNSTPFFPFTCSIQVRGYEIDVYKHVNNAVYLQYFEHARWQMQLSGLLPPLEDNDLLTIVRHIRIDYLRPTHINDLLNILLWPRSVGYSSMVFGGAIRLMQSQTHPQHIGEITTLATQVLACNHLRLGKVEVPKVWRALFPEIDPGDRPPH